MHLNYEAFPAETEQMNFVSNVPCAFLDASLSSCQFDACDPPVFKSLLSKLQSEYASASAATTKLMHYVRADLSLHDSSAHIKGKLHDFVTSQVGSIDYNPDTLYKTIVEECRTRSKYTGGVTDFPGLIKFKSITRNQVTGWLDQVKSKLAVPEWSAVSNSLNVSGIELGELSREWSRYRAVALDAGDASINKVRDRIREELKIAAGSSLGMDELVDHVLANVHQFARSNMPLFRPARLKVMILYEVFTYDPTGKV